MTQSCPQCGHRQAQNLHILTATNAHRSHTAAMRTIPRARSAIRTLNKVILLPPDMKLEQRRRQYLAALRARVLYPDHSLADIANILRITKHTYAARLYRAITFAEKLDRRTT